MQKLTRRWILAHITLHPTHPDCGSGCALGPHLFTLTAGFNTQVKLQWNIIIWRHLLTLTAHEVQFLSYPPPNRRTEQWEQTRCLIRAEVSALKRWNAKAKFPPKSVLSLYLSLPSLSVFLSSLPTLPFQERCHFHYSHEKMLSALFSKCWEISESL